MKRFVATGTAMLALSGVALADGFIGLNDFSGGETVIDFNSTDMGSLGHPTANIGSGVVVTDSGGGTGGPGWRGNTDWGSYFDNIPGSSQGRALADSWGASDLLFDFTGAGSPNRAGLLLSTGTRTDYDIVVYDPSGNILDTGVASMPANSEAVFVGYEANGGVGFIRVSDVENGQICIMDDVRFESFSNGIFQPSYNQAMAIDGSPAQLEQTSMNMTGDGSSFWSCSGGSSGGNRLAQFDAGGNWVASYQPGIDMRSVFSVGGNSAQVYCRGYNSNVVQRMTSPGVFAPHATLSGGTLDAQSQVEFNSAGNEYIAHIGGNISRWDLSGSHLGDVALSGFGSMFGEDTYPQNRGVISANGYYLTYSNGNLSAWDASGNRVGNTVLNGAGNSFDSHFSLSWANGKVWIIDTANGTWRGYLIPELISGINLTVSGSCPGRVVVSWSNAQPNATVALIFARNTGSFVIPFGPCRGTVLGLGNSGIRLVSTFPSGLNGTGSRTGNAGAPSCGGYLQMHDIPNCTLSNVAQLP